MLDIFVVHYNGLLINFTALTRTASGTRLSYSDHAALFIIVTDTKTVNSVRKSQKIWPTFSHIFINSILNSSWIFMYFCSKQKDRTNK